MRFPEELIMKNRDRLRKDLSRIPVIKFYIKYKESLKYHFVKISEELIMKNRDSLRVNILRIPAVKFFTKHEESLKR